MNLISKMNEIIGGKSKMNDEKGRQIITQKHWTNIDGKLFRNHMTYGARKVWMNERFVVDNDVIGQIICEVN